MIAITTLVALSAAKGCGYEDPGLPPHPVEPTQHTIDPSSTDYPTIPPVENMGSAPSSVLGSPCTRSGQERRDPNTGVNLVCKNGKWEKK